MSEEVEVLKSSLEALKDAVVHALGDARDFENFPASEVNYLQCIRRLVQRQQIMIDLLADKDPRRGRLDVTRMLDGLEEEIVDGESILEIKNNTLARRVHDLENENAMLNRQNRRLGRDVECDGCFQARLHTPEDTEQVVCFLQDDQYVILGHPDDWEHDCDAMGCSSVSHVVRRVPKHEGQG